jgi:aminocarboxymuconate-semialdehyde decarboxylase
MRIDVHGHYLPAEYIDFQAQVRGEGVRQDMAIKLQGKIDERVGMLDEAGVDLQVLSLGSNVPYHDRESDAVEAARLANDAYAGIARQYAGRLAAFGSVPLPHVDAAIAEASRCLGELNMLGITLGCSVYERTLDDPAFAPFWAELNRRKAVVFLHPIFRATDAHIRDYELARMVGACFEDTLAALRLLLSGVIDRNPDLRVIVPHFGGFLPFLLERLNDEAEREGHAGIRPAVATPPSELVKTLWFDTVNCHPAALRCACESFGADRIMLGTDFPYLAGERFERAVTYVADAGLSEADTAAIYAGNAQALLGLGS